MVKDFSREAFFHSAAVKVVVLGESGGLSCRGPSSASRYGKAACGTFYLTDRIFYTAVQSAELPFQSAEQPYRKF